MTYKALLLLTLILLNGSILGKTQSLKDSATRMPGISQSSTDTTEGQGTTSKKGGNFNPWSVHYQLTIISMSHPGFHADYSGRNSLVDTAENGLTSLTTTAYIGRSLWKGAHIYFNPEVAGGKGFSGTTGMAAFPNGEIYRVGNPTPTLYVARAYLQQDIPLGHHGYTKVEDDVNQVEGMVPDSRITLSAGKFSLDDFYDDNAFSHDARSQFMNWALMSNGAWDYPANVRGYTLGLVAELIKPSWAVRMSMVQEPNMANGPDLDPEIFKAYGLTAEGEKSWHIGGLAGTARLLLTLDKSRAPTYKEAITAAKEGDSTLVYVLEGSVKGQYFHGYKYGAGLSVEQNLSDIVGVFLRAGWNDGKTGTWAFTEIDQTLSGGVQVTGKKWKRPDDVVGGAFVISGLSADHRSFLEQGFYGYIIGDGALNYGHEGVLEFYYKARLFPHMYLSADYQFCANPAFNRDRGPVNVYGFRGHIEF